MTRVEIVAIALMLLVPASARASGFEFCDFEAEIQRVEIGPEQTYELVVDVVRASKAEKYEVESYTDCAEYVGKPIEVTFGVSELPSVPAKGDSILFSRSVIDGFSMDGSYAGTTTRTTLRKLRKAASATAER